MLTYMVSFIGTIVAYLLYVYLTDTSPDVTDRLDYYFNLDGDEE